MIKFYIWGPTTFMYLAFFIFLSIRRVMCLKSIHIILLDFVSYSLSACGDYELEYHDSKP